VGSASSIKTRWGRHVKQLNTGTHDNPKLQHAWDKYGAKAFEFEVVVHCPKYSLFQLEQATIDALDAVNSGYNIAKVAGSSMAGRNHSEATKWLMSKNRKGKKKSVEWVEGRKTRKLSDNELRALRDISSRRTPEYISWQGRKGMAKRLGREFNEPKPAQCFHEKLLSTPLIEQAASAV
jgi:group I intron endonuclease